MSVGNYPKHVRNTLFHFCQLPPVKTKIKMLILDHYKDMSVGNYPKLDSKYHNFNNFVCCITIIDYTGKKKKRKTQKDFTKAHFHYILYCEQQTGVIIYRSI